MCPSALTFSRRLALIRAAALAAILRISQKRNWHATKLTPRFCVICLFLFSTSIFSTAQFKTLFTFNKADGAPPNGFLVQGFDGNLYGTAFAGGAHGAGTIFRSTSAGETTILYNFCGRATCTDGQFTHGGLSLDPDGNYYGVTSEGGGNETATCLGAGCGTVYKLTPAGALTTVYRFCSLPNCADGQFPSQDPAAPLVLGPDGDFYGTTTAGGAGAGCLVLNIDICGTIFKITRDGHLATLYSFCSETGCEDGADPSALVLGIDGNFYGVAGGGGGNEGGTFFRITPSGTLTTLYNFCAQANCADGNGPNSLTLGNDGDFYGTTIAGGLGTSLCLKQGEPTCGTVFRITPEGVLTTLYDFCFLANCADGAYPGAIMQATDGNFYGVTTFNGTTGKGTLFKLTPDGSLTTLRTFTSNTPSGALVQATNGNLYGTTANANHSGTLYEFVTHMAPFVNTVPTSGRGGSKVLILGTGLSDATAVNFNGTPAEFTVLSDSEIRTSVPSGSGSGVVTVTTPANTFSSGVVFRVP